MTCYYYYYSCGLYGIEVMVTTSSAPKPVWLVPLDCCFFSFVFMSGPQNPLDAKTALVQKDFYRLSDVYRHTLAKQFLLLVCHHAHVVYV